MLSFLFSPTLTSIHDYWINHAATAKSLQSCPTLCDPIDSSLPGSPVTGILQARTLGSVAISFSNAWKWKVKSESEVAQLCPTLCNPMDCSLPGSSVHAIFPGKSTWVGCHRFLRLLAWRVSIERSAVIFMRIPLCVICCFTLAAFNIWKFLLFYQSPSPLTHQVLKTNHSTLCFSELDLFITLVL